MTGEVRRDAYGIPHLRAPDVLALARLQGRVAAQDRAWQMELERWRMEGRTAETLGPAWLGWDVFARQVRLEATARAAFEALDPATRAWVEAYVEGVDEALPAAAGRSPELAGLGVTASTVRPWAPWTPLGVFFVQHVLFASFPGKLWRSLVAERLGPDALDLLSIEGATGGSNAVGVAGRHTDSGLPVIAGDPHRTIELPGVYAQVRLACPDFDVVGLAFPGVPGVQHFGHAGEVAWAITNAMADYQDLYREELRTGPDGLQVREADGWRAAAPSTETVRVRDADPVEVTVLVTARGPVVTGLDPSSAPGSDPAPVHSLRVPSQVGADLGFGALLPLLRSRSTEDVERALDAWVEPVNSVVVADTTGRLRHLLAGRVPDRDARLRRLPGRGWDPADRWRPGWVARPARDVEDHVVNANDRASGGGLGEEYAPPHRALRLDELVREQVAAGPVTPAGASRLSLDTKLGAVEVARPFLARAQVADAAEVLRRRLLDWDARCDAGSPTAGAWADWRHELVAWFVAHPALAPLQQPHPHAALFGPWLHVPARVGLAWERLLTRGAVLGIDPDEGVRVALERAAARADARPWGERHRLAADHGLGRSTGTDVPLAGDANCVLATSTAPGVGDSAVKGPVARYVWDLADRGRSGWVVPFGSSGDPGSPHHLDQLPLWLSGELVPLVTDWDRLVPDPTPEPEEPR
ncbi:penicillin acylase family protein [Auraticoccus monumenti]|uniref:Penicillin amidase n=1 Tax=Auraticoccus monumenti TaxID=675864 RepID=A0A1G6X8L6_9ACTN|nr:penicillin acylase family protein [Auraticoccus monumenti]SDD74540.1 penicillin amidase [Auraticoccus monumenti]